MFVDDTPDAAQIEDIYQAVQRLQEHVNCLSKWFNKWNIRLIYPI